MQSLNLKLKELAEHLEKLNETFLKKDNYSEEADYNWYKQNHDEFEDLATKTDIKELKYATIENKKVGLSFADEIYHQYDRQMKLADIIEFLFFSRGIYFIFQTNQFKEERVSIFLKLILRYVNLLMSFENTTVDKKLRGALLNNLKDNIGKEAGFKEIENWKTAVGVPKSHPEYNKDAPDDYFDSLLPKTAGGLWHEMLVFAFILKYNIGYIFPLLLHQKPISLDGKLSPPDLVILHKKTYRYYGIEIGSLKERQSGGFMSPSGIPVIPIDTLNSRTDRCPSCGKWIGICEKVIEEFSGATEHLESDGEIRCLVECNKFTLDEKLNGKCPVMKFRYSTKIAEHKFGFADNKHYHYNCCMNSDERLISAIKKHKDYEDLQKLDELLRKNDCSEEEVQFKETKFSHLKSKFNFLKTHSIFYKELETLRMMNNQISSFVRSGEKIGKL